MARQHPPRCRTTGKFFPNYFIPLAAPLAILCALAVEYVWQRRYGRSPGFAGIATLASIIAAPPLLYYMFVAIPSLRGLGVTDVAREIADDLRRSEPNHPVLYVVDYQPIIYFLADAPPPTRFPFPAHLIDDINYSGVDPVHEVDAILARQPDFIVISRAFLDLSKTGQPISQMVARFVNENYELKSIFLDNSVRDHGQIWGSILLYRRL